MNSEETLEQPTQQDAVLRAIAELSKKIDGLQSEFGLFKVETNTQLESVRQGIVDNSARFDRLEGNFLLLRATITEWTEEVRHNRKVLV